MAKLLGIVVCMMPLAAIAISFGLSLICDVLLYSRRWLWRFRIPLSLVILATTAFSASALLFLDMTLWTVLFSCIALYRIVVTFRAIWGRSQEIYLLTSARHTVRILLLAQCIVLAGQALWTHHSLSDQAIWDSVTSVLLISSICLLASTFRRYRRTRWPLHVKGYTDTELPSITVAIPARNETEDLQACLESLIASNYPKLEVIVYDDCSQERRTPEIIRSFAHDGVRFIDGQEPIASWLAKNTAYNRLYQESNGEYIVFCGVDIRFGPDSLTRLISFMKTSKKRMVSIIPRRDAAVYGRFSMIQAMRYFWELAPPRRLFNRPPVMGSCWAIERTALKEAGAFAAVSRSIVPEAYFAKRLLDGDAYSFRRADRNLGIVSAKSAVDQRNTGVRVRYPQVHKRPENVLLVALLEFGLLVFPYGVLVFGPFEHLSATAWLRISFACVFLSISYMIVAVTTHINRWWFAAIGLPFVVLTDIGLLHYSMWRYEFSTVDWKGRNVCVPAMHVYPHLPKLSDRG